MELDISVEVKEGHSLGIVVANGDAVCVGRPVGDRTPVPDAVFDIVAFQPLEGMVNCGARVEEISIGVASDV